jgi:phosphopantothenoylcysteine synthetase/decarboxylase
MSRGTFGSKIASEIIFYGYDLTFLHAAESRMPEKLYQSAPFADNYNPVSYVTFDDYAERLSEALEEQPDFVILAAAVSDYGVDNYVDGKIRSGDDLVIKLKPLPKLISTVRERCPKAVICGFKLLVNSAMEELREASVKSLVDNKLDLVVGNDLRDIKADDHKLLIVENLNGNVVSSLFAQDEFYRPRLSRVVFDKCMEHYVRKYGRK